MHTFNFGDKRRDGVTARSRANANMVGGDAQLRNRSTDTHGHKTLRYADSQAGGEAAAVAACFHHSRASTYLT